MIVDAAIFSEKNAFGICIIARNHMGDLIRVKSLSIPGVVAVEFAEIMVI